MHLSASLLMQRNSIAGRLHYALASEECHNWLLLFFEEWTPHLAILTSVDRIAKP